MDSCLFCLIVNGKLPCHKVWEDEHFLAFLSIHAIKEGHTLVIPKKHFPYTFEIPDSDYTDFWVAAKKVATLLKSKLSPKTGKIGSIVYGMDVDHAHIHLVSIDKSGDLNFANAKPTSGEELKAVLAKLT